MSQNYTRKDLKSHIIDYYDEYGKLPKTSDINEKNNCPNRGVFVKYTGVKKCIEIIKMNLRYKINVYNILFQNFIKLIFQNEND